MSATEKHADAERGGAAVGTEREEVKVARNFITNQLSQ